MAAARHGDSVVRRWSDLEDCHSAAGGHAPLRHRDELRQCLYNVNALKRGRVAVLVEGPFDVLAIEQAAADLVTSVARGTTGARRMRWMTRLALCLEVLIALDTEEERNTAAAQAIGYWHEVLQPRARRWRPYLKDCGEMLEHGWMCGGG